MFGIFFTNYLLISDLNMPSHSPPIVWSGDPDMPGVDIRECRVNIPKCTYVLGEEQFGEEQSIIDSIMESVNITVPLRVVKDIPVLNSLFSPILASNCPLPPVAGGSVPDSGSDGGPLLNLSDTELVADLEGFGRLNLIDPVPQSDEHVSDNNYQFRTRRTDMADKIEESSHISECSVNIGKCTSVSGEGYVEEEQSTVSGEEHSEEEQSINNEDSDWADDIVESKKSKLPKAASNLKASNKRTKGVYSVTRVQFDDVDLPEEDDSDTECEDQNKELVGGRRRKFGEQIKESVSQHLLEDDENEIDAKLSEIAQVAEERANREDTESEDELSAVNKTQEVGK